MRQINSAIVLAAMLYCQMTPASAAQILMRGDISCGKWLTQSLHQAVKDRNIAWILGFVSALALANGVDVLNERNTDSEAMIAWVDKYCADNPLLYTSDAGTKLFFELLRALPTTENKSVPLVRKKQQ